MIQEKIAKISKKQKIIIIILILISMLIVFIWIYKMFYTDDEQNVDLSSENIIEENFLEGQEEEQDSKIGILQNNKNKIIVDVIGEVNNPGVVTLNNGARIIDAIKAAGGKTEEADLSKVNLAYVLEDGVQLYIPKINEDKNKDNQEITQESSVKIEDLESKENTQVEYIRTDAGEEGIITTEVQSSANSSSNNSKDSIKEKININNASKEKLEELSGVGQSIAQKIIEYRQKNGRFKTIEDIKKVSGIGESKFNNIKDNIKVK